MTEVRSGKLDDGINAQTTINFQLSTEQTTDNREPITDPSGASGQATINYQLVTINSEQRSLRASNLQPPTINNQQSTTHYQRPTINKPRTEPPKSIEINKFT